MLLIILETCSKSLQDEGRAFWGREQHRNNSAKGLEKKNKNTSSLQFTEGKDPLRQHQHKFRLKPRLLALGFQVFGKCL